MVQRCFLVGVMLLACLLMVGCMVPEEEHEAVVRERDAYLAQIAPLQHERDAAQAQIATLQRERDAAQAEIKTLQQEVKKLQTQLNEAQWILEGLDKVAAESAADTEFANVQTAVIALMVDNGLSTLPNPVTTATNDMGAFPDTSVCGVGKMRDPDENAYIPGRDKDGYLLYQHDIAADGTRLRLVNYVATRYTKGTYTVDASGIVTQVTTGYE